METKLFRKILAGCIFATMIIIAIIGCKKKDSTDPVPTPTPEPVQKDVFTNPKLYLLSEYEQNQAKTFQAFGMYHCLDELGPMDIFNEAYGIFSAIQGYETNQQIMQQFNKIDGDLNNIQGQLTTLESDFTNLTTLLGYNMMELMNGAYLLSTWTQVAPIITAFSNADENGFRWFSYEAKMHNTQSSSDSTFIVKELNPKMKDFAKLYTSGANATTLQDAINYLNLQFQHSSSSNGLMNAVAKFIITQDKNASPINQYMVLENYFLQVINYELQAGVIQLNCWQIEDTNSVPTFRQFLASTITSQIQYFLNAANQLAVSTYDYRNLGQYERDVTTYLNTGISPDTIAGHMLARAQFVANLLYKAFDVSTPVLCGSIVLPNYYSTGSGIASYNLYVGNNGLTPRVDTLIKSPFPYAFWNNGVPAICSPDNQWRVYNYGFFGGTQQVLPSSPVTIQLGNESWAPSAAAKGNITPLWYNPRNPHHTSTTRNDSCIIEFAYFSASWKWGYLLPCHTLSGAQTCNIGNYSTIGSTSNECNCPYGQPTPPFVQQFHSSQCLFESGGNGYLTYGNSIFERTFSGTFYPYSSGQIYAADLFYWDVISYSDLGAGMSLFMYYNWEHFAGITEYHYWFRIGDLFNLDTYCYSSKLQNGYNCNGSILYTTSTMGSGVSTSPLTVNTAYSIGYEVEYGLWELKNNCNFTFQTNMYPQIVYNGRSSDF